MTFYCVQKDEKFKDVVYEEGTDWEEILCPKFSNHQRAGNRIGNLRFNVNDKKLSDFLWTFLSECIINEHTATLLTKHGVTGYDLKEANVMNIEASNTSFWELLIKGRGGDAHKNSGIYLKHSCEYCGYQRYSAYENGIIVDLNNWDRSDIFTINGYPNHILITENVKQILEINQIVGISIIPSHDLRWPDIRKP